MSDLLEKSLEDELRENPKWFPVTTPEETPCKNCGCPLSYHTRRYRINMGQFLVTMEQYGDPYELPGTPIAGLMKASTEGTCPFYTPASPIQGVNHV